MKFLKSGFIFLFFITTLALVVNQFAHSFRISAQTKTPLTQLTQPLTDLQTASESSDSASAAADMATPSTNLASSSAQVEEIIQKKKDEDITETGGKQKSFLAAILDEHPIDQLTWYNPLQYMMRLAVAHGLPANLIVLMILFPLIALVVAFSRHIIGLQGFGIYIPAVLAVAFLSTGIMMGILIFVAVILSATFTRRLVKFFRLPVLPRTAMLLLGVSVLMMLLIMSAAILDLSFILTVNIFPILIIILLTENFMSTQLFTSQKESLNITVETLFVALVCSLIVSSTEVQKFIILRPEITLITIAILNWVIGRYTGLRVLEYLRFKELFHTNSGSGNVLNLPPDDHETPEE